MVQSKLAFAVLAALSTFTLSACTRTASTKDAKVAAVSSQSLVAPNGGFSDKTPAQRRAAWLHSKTGEN